MYQCKYCGKEFENRFKCNGHAARCSKNPTNTTLHTCKYCGKTLVGQHSHTQHENHCEKNPQKIEYNSSINITWNTPEVLFCSFCKKQCKNKNSLVQHEQRCKLNPNSLYKDPSRNKGGWPKGRPAWNAGLTKETDARVMSHSKSLHNFYANNPQASTGGIKSYTAKKCKYGTYNGFYCDSGWELAFLIYNLDHGNNIERCVDYFEYTYNDKVHKYYPDFIINGIYYEIKGIYRPEDYYKIDQFPEHKKLVVIDETNISYYLNYVEKLYGKDFACTLYDRSYPCWLDKSDPDKKYSFKVNQNIAQ